MATKESTLEPDVNVERVNDEPQKDEDASDAQAQVITSLRSQVTDLFSQVTQLNGKLVQSYDRISNLEDQLHISESSLRNATLTISSLELERTHHLAALNTGLLVEKEHVTAELNRLMERATEEAAQRGQAETARNDIEKELDDLSASLFQQANTMVAEARLGQAMSERKVREAEEAFRGAEEAIQIMQTQMQALQAGKEGAERQAEEARSIMGKGKWLERDVQLLKQHPEDIRKMRLITVHVPYAEFIAFITHVRGLKNSQTTSPPIPSLVGLPFLARLLSDDSEPTVRLDLAPSLNWLSRRSVLTAIYTGMLIVEPVPFSSLVQELYPHSQTNAPVSISCALCGTAIVRAQSHDNLASHSLASITRGRNNGNLANGNSWFKNPLSNSSLNYVGHDISVKYPEQVYIFRLAPTPAVAPASLTLHASAPSTSAFSLSRPPAHPTVTTRTGLTQTQQPYPLCTSNYCLLRLRSTCSLWAFVRTGVIERLWEEEPGILDRKPAIVNADGTESAQENIFSVPASETPPVPPRRRRLWEMASALGERAVNWTETSGGKGRDKEAAGKLPPAPPAHPSVPHPRPQAPPPLPKRSEERERIVTVSNDADKNPSSEAKKSNSQESFTTPVDMTFSLPTPIEGSNSGDPPLLQMQPQPTILKVYRSPSPRAVPLPETPTSPVFRTTSTSPRPGERVAFTPSSVPVTKRSSSPFTARTGSPVRRGAPAIPRRAAARRAVPAPPTGAQTGNPTPSPKVSKEENLLKAEATDSTKKEKKLHSALEHKGAAGEDGAIEPPLTKHEFLENHKSFPDASLNGGDLSATKQVLMDASPQTSEEPPSTTVDGNDSSSEASQTSRPSEDSSLREKSIDTSSTKHSSATDEEGYACDATWEERTWKEIVRLKEQMFWARVGGVR